MNGTNVAVSGNEARHERRGGNTRSRSIQVHRSRRWPGSRMKERLKRLADRRSGEWRIANRVRIEQFWQQRRRNPLPITKFGNSRGEISCPSSNFGNSRGKNASCEAYFPFASASGGSDRGRFRSFGAFSAFEEGAMSSAEVKISSRRAKSPSAGGYFPLQEDIFLRKRRFSLAGGIFLRGSSPVVSCESPGVGALAAGPGVQDLLRITADESHARGG